MERKKITTENVQHNEYVIRTRNMQKGRAGREKTLAHAEIDNQLSVKCYDLSKLII